MRASLYSIGLSSCMEASKASGSHDTVVYNMQVPGIVTLTLDRSDFPKEMAADIFLSAANNKPLTTD